jgi:hypothetical protein
MIEEIKNHVSFLRTGDRLLPGVVAKFNEFHGWALQQLRSETRWVSRNENWTSLTADGDLQDTGRPLPPKLVCSDRYLAIERLMVLLATIPRLQPAERRSRANEIAEACDYFDRKRTKKTDTEPDNPKQNRIISDDAKSIVRTLIKAKKQGKKTTQKKEIERYVLRYPKKRLSVSSLGKQVSAALKKLDSKPDK